MIRKKRVADNFSKSSKLYDETALFQKYAAEKLATIISSDFEFTKPLNILELGCGTGFLSEKLLGLFPHSKFTLCDISGEMLEQCKKKLGDVDSENVKFSHADMSKGVDEKSYDLIVSGLAIQWLKDLPAFMNMVHAKLNINGAFYFSTLGDLTFKTLYDSFTAVGVKYPGPQLLPVNDITKSCSCFYKKEIEIEDYKEKYSSVMEFLKHIQVTGTGNATDTPVSIRDLRQVIRYYNNNFAESPELDVQTCYQLVIGKCVKK